MRLSTSFLVELALSSSVYSATWQVTVGANNALTFIPSSVMAQPGDMVQFNFVSQVGATLLESRPFD
jgi:plastocyanin